MGVLARPKAISVAPTLNLIPGEASSEWLQTRAANLQPAGSCKPSCSEKLAENARAFLVANRKAATASELFYFIANIQGN